MISQIDSTTQNRRAIFEKAQREAKLAAALADSNIARRLAEKSNG